MTTTQKTLAQSLKTARTLATKAKKPKDEQESKEMTREEQEAGQGLDIAHFPGKWRQAQRLAESNERRDDNRLLPYWERVRLLYLELGGEFIGQKYGDKQ